MGIDDLTATERLAWRWAPHDEAIVFQHRNRCPEAELNPGALAGIQPLAVEQGDARWELGGPGEEIDLVILLQGNRRIRQEAKAGVEALARGHDPGRGQHVAALNLLRGDSREVDRRPPSRQRAGDLLLVALQSPHARPAIAGVEAKLVPRGDLAPAQRPGDDGAEPGDGEDAVDR